MWQRSPGLSRGAVDSRTQGRHGKRISVSWRYKSRRSGRLTSICARDARQEQTAGLCVSRRRRKKRKSSRGGGGDAKGRREDVDFDAGLFFCNHPQLPAVCHSPLPPSPLLLLLLNARQECISPHPPPVQSPCLKSHLRLLPALSSFPSSILPVLSVGRAPARPPAAAAGGPTDTIIVLRRCSCVRPRVLTPATCAVERRSHEALSSVPSLSARGASHPLVPGCPVTEEWPRRGGGAGPGGTQSGPLWRSHVF